MPRLQRADLPLPASASRAWQRQDLARVESLGLKAGPRPPQQLQRDLGPLLRCR